MDTGKDMDTKGYGHKRIWTQKHMDSNKDMDTRKDMDTKWYGHELGNGLEKDMDTKKDTDTEKDMDTDEWKRIYIFLIEYFEENRNGYIFFHESKLIYSK